MLAADHGAESEEFEEMAPLVLDCMNATDVLIRLIELGSDVETVHQVADALRELGTIEQSDALKLYRGRKSGISALTSLIEKGDLLWKTQGIESELQDLLKRAPWLIHPQYTRYATSDESLDKVYSRIARELQIDKFAPEVLSKKAQEENQRPDLVFVMGPASSAVAAAIVVVELKSPTIPLEIGHLQQLKHYMARVGDYMASSFGPGKTYDVRGILIGRRGDPQSSAQGVYMLEKEELDAGVHTKWEVWDLDQMVHAALQAHVQEIEALENDLPEESALKVTTNRSA
jgi:hypothetical protein